MSTEHDNAARATAIATREVLSTGTLSDELAALTPEERATTLALVDEALALLPDAIAQLPEQAEPQPATGSFLDPVPVLYRNWRGEERVRQLAPSLAPGGPLVWCKADEWHGAGWRLRCLDAEAGHTRMYPLANILAWGAEAIEERQRQQSAERSLVAMGYTHRPGVPLWRPALGPAPDFEAADRHRDLAEQLRDWAQLLTTESPRLLATLEEAAAVLEAVPLARRQRQERSPSGLPATVSPWQS